MLRRAFPKTARRVLTAVLLVGFLAVGVTSVAPRLDTDRGSPDVEALISLLRVPNEVAQQRPPPHGALNSQNPGRWRPAAEAAGWP
jgi:hypothetical protein